MSSPVSCSKRCSADHTALEVETQFWKGSPIRGIPGNRITVMAAELTLNYRPGQKTPTYRREVTNQYVLSGQPSSGAQDSSKCLCEWLERAVFVAKVLSSSAMRPPLTLHICASQNDGPFMFLQFSLWRVIKGGKPTTAIQGQLQT